MTADRPILRTSPKRSSEKFATSSAILAGAAPDCSLSFGGYAQEAARALFRRGVARRDQLRGQPLGQGLVVGIPLRVQPRPLGDLRDHHLLPFAAPAAQVAQRSQKTLAQFFEPFRGLACQAPHLPLLLVSFAARQDTRKHPVPLASLTAVGRRKQPSRHTPSRVALIQRSAWKVNSQKFGTDLACRKDDV